MTTASGDGKPGAAAAGTDAESGAASEDPASDLRALEAMARRGLVDQETYAQRRRELLAQLGSEQNG